MRGLLCWVLGCMWIAAWFCSCGGDTSVGIDVSNEQSQTQGAQKPVDDPSDACAVCIGNPEDDQSDGDCLADFGLTADDC